MQELFEAAVLPWPRVGELLIAGAVLTDAAVELVTAFVDSLT